MANSSLISLIKDKVIAEVINDEAFFYAINSPDIESVEDAEELINTHIFRYNQNPLTLDKTITYITFQVHIPDTYSISYFSRQVNYRLWSKIQLEIWIISHERCMKVDNIPKIKADRNDYISQLLDEKFNGRQELGLPEDPNKVKLIGALDLVSNTEGALQHNYLYRRMLFETKDLNDSLCDGGKYGIHQ